MTTAFRFFKNTLYLAVADFIRPFIAVCFVIYISRTLGSEGLGAYAAIMAFFFFFEKVAQAGFHHLIIRDVAVDKTRANTYLANAILIAIASSLITMPLLMLVLKLVNYPGDLALNIRILSLSMVFVVLKNFYLSFFDAIQRMEYKSLISISQEIMRTGIGILMIYLGFGINGLIWSLVFYRIVISFLCLFILSRLGIKPEWKIDWQLLISLLKQSSTFLLIGLITTTYWRVDVVMLTKMRGVEEVGFYTAAYRFLEILKGFSYAYIAALYPIFASAFYGIKKAFVRKVSLSIRYLFIFSFPVALGTTILADKIILLVYGDGFSGSIHVLKILIWTICFFPIALVFAKGLVSSKNQKYDLQANVIAMIINILLNYFLIGLFGIYGAALSTTVSIIVFMSIQYYFLSRHLFAVRFIHELFKPVAAGLVMGLFTFLAHDLPLAIVFAVSVLIYMLMLFVLKTFSKDEIDTFKGIWMKKSMLIAFKN